MSLIVSRRRSRRRRMPQAESGLRIALVAEKGPEAIMPLIKTRFRVDDARSGLARLTGLLGGQPGRNDFLLASAAQGIGA